MFPLDSRVMMSTPGRRHADPPMPYMSLDGTNCPVSRTSTNSVWHIVCMILTPSNIRCARCTQTLGAIRGRKLCRATLALRHCARNRMRPHCSLASGKCPPVNCRRWTSLSRHCCSSQRMDVEMVKHCSRLCRGSKVSVSNCYRFNKTDVVIVTNAAPGRGCCLWSSNVVGFPPPPHSTAEE
jgi:hypothetical protein